MRKITWECDKNHTWLAKYNSIKNGQWCPFCAGKIKKSIDDCHQLAKSRGGRCLSEKYLNNRTNLYWECGVNTDHKWFATYHSIKSSGTWCPYCAADKKTSRGEQELADFVQGFVRVIRNNRTVIGPYELDIWVPDLQIGIEYDGGYWHDLPEMMERDALKDKMCQEAGILLLRVTDKNWDKDRDQTKIEILQFLLEAASPKVSSSP
jgi:very-short-patch-repair endonuclease